MVALACLLAIFNIALLIQNRTLKHSSTTNRSIVMAPGKTVSSLSGINSEGQKVTFDYGQERRKTILLIFSPHCGYCTENMPNWKLLIEKLDPKLYRIVATSIFADGVKEYAEKYRLNSLPVIAEIDPRNRVEYEMSVTPETIVISSEGKVEKIWIGLLQEKEMSEIEDYLQVNLSSTSKAS
ncbi:MAG: peroxiredoxin family protein [Pyrinomonadaceae bacterium]